MRGGGLAPKDIAVVGKFKRYNYGMALRLILEKLIVPFFDLIYIRRSINSFVFKLPFSVSRFYKDGEESAFFKTLSLWAEGTCLDIGAHIGLTTVIMGNQCNLVHAFEPSPKNFRYLSKVIVKNGLRNAITHQCAVAGHTGVRDFSLRSGRANNGNSLIDFSKNMIRMSIKVVKLDDLGIQFDVAKIDAEGAEIEILVGAEKAFKSLKKMLLSVHIKVLKEAGLEPNLVIDKLTSWGGLIFDRNLEEVRSLESIPVAVNIVELFIVFPKNHSNWEIEVEQARQIAANHSKNLH